MINRKKDEKENREGQSLHDAHSTNIHSSKKGKEPVDLARNSSYSKLETEKT
jgi:hypothetical protein